MGGLLHLVQCEGDWAGWCPAQSPSHCTKCNGPIKLRQPDLSLEQFRRLLKTHLFSYRLRRLVTLTFRRRVQVYLLTYLLTYLPINGQCTNFILFDVAL